MARDLTAKLICGFVFAYAKNRFSHDAAHIKVGCKGVYITRTCYHDATFSPILDSKITQSNEVKRLGKYKNKNCLEDGVFDTVSSS